MGLEHQTEPLVPQHIAMIMDGDGRWAKSRFLPRAAGHKAGVKTVRKMVEACQQRHIKVLTLFVFSSENWVRPADEVSLLMRLLMQTLSTELARLHQEGVRLRIMGDLSQLSLVLQTQIHEAELLTQYNTGLQLVMALNYGGRWDMVQATQRLAQEVALGQREVASIDEHTVAQYLYLSDLPAVDLLIRTGGDQRISNFLLWQAAYAELYFTSTYWPDFDEPALVVALDEYARRERRFGQISE